MKNLQRQVIEAYFLYPTEGVPQLAQRLNIQPEIVLQHLLNRGLPVKFTVRFRTEPKPVERIT